MNGRDGYSQSPQGISSFSPEILNECKAIDRGIDVLQSKMEQVLRKQRESLTDPAPMDSAIKALTTEVLGDSNNLSVRIQRLKANPKHLEPSNKPQVDRVQRRLGKANQEFLSGEAAHERELKADGDRQLQIIHPDWTKEQREEAMQNNQQSGHFATAIMQGSRQKDANNALIAVQGRHQAIQEIARTVILVNQIQTELHTQIIMHDTTVNQINERSEAVQQDVSGANTQLDGAIKSARAANRKKWICLGIALLIIIIIVIIVVIVVKVVVK
ncbi:Plasma membrane t-SNARE, secretory vesicle fusion [Trapelia coarctata]|nr:Plasma membrane t-SNARE, secretory vesicle fusion [Trapelia coarctata]